MLIALGVGSLPGGSPSADSLDRFVDATIAGWCDEHGPRDDLQVAVVDVHFRPEPPHFVEGEGTVVAPLALDLPGAQRVLDVASHPAALRHLEVQGVTAVAWEYAGRLNRELRFAGAALVERPARTPVTPAAAPSFDSLPSELSRAALARASDLEEHSLDECAVFAEWAKVTAGPGPYTDQMLRLAHATAKPFTRRKNEPDDLCAAMREGRFTPHRAQVSVVMAARELGIPAFGFASASDREVYLVGTLTDAEGWILLDVEHPDAGWFLGGPALLTVTPLLAGFEASRHDFWRPEGAAYARQAWGVSSFSRTRWRGRLGADHEPTDTTGARTLRLAEVCR